MLEVGTCLVTRNRVGGARRCDVRSIGRRYRLGRCLHRRAGQTRHSVVPARMFKLPRSGTRRRRHDPSARRRRVHIQLERSDAGRSVRAYPNDDAARRTRQADTSTKCGCHRLPLEDERVALGCDRARTRRGRFEADKNHITQTLARLRPRARLRVSANPR